MSNATSNAKFISWIRCHARDPRDLNWYHQLGRKLLSLRPEHAYGKKWIPDLITETRKVGIVGLTRDVLYKSLAFAAAASESDAIRFTECGLRWTHATLALGGVGLLPKNASQKEKEVRNERLRKILDDAASGRWSVRRLRDEILKVGEGHAPRGGRPTKPHRSLGIVVDLRRLLHCSSEWTRYAAVWQAIGRAGAVKPPPIESETLTTLLGQLDEVVESATCLRVVLRRHRWKS